MTWFVLSEPTRLLSAAAVGLLVIGAVFLLLFAVLAVLTASALKREKKDAAE